MPAKIIFAGGEVLPVQEDLEDLVTRLKSSQPDNWLELRRTGTNDRAFVRVGSVAFVEGPGEAVGSPSSPDS